MSNGAYLSEYWPQTFRSCSKWLVWSFFIKNWQCVKNPHLAYPLCTSTLFDRRQHQLSSSKKCKNFLYSFGSPSLGFHFTYTNLNMVFYKFIMAGRKSCPPKRRQEIPVGIASSPRPKLPSKSGWAIYCEPDWHASLHFSAKIIALLRALNRIFAG